MASNDKEDDLYETVSKMAERLGLKGSEKGKYIHEHMTRGGYKAVPNYVLANDDDDDDDKGSGFFGGSGGRGRSCQRGRSRDDDEDSWYS